MWWQLVSAGSKSLDPPKTCARISLADGTQLSCTTATIPFIPELTRLSDSSITSSVPLSRPCSPAMLS